MDQEKTIPLWKYIATATAECEKLCAPGDLNEQDLKALGDFRPVVVAYQAYRAELIKLKNAAANLHKCKHCGVMTTHPDEECYKAS